MDYPDKVREAYDHATNERGWVATQNLDVPYPEHGDRWGEWEFDANDLVLVHVTPTDRRNYEVDLKDMTSSAQVLDWIYQVNTKGWASTQVIGDLVKAIDDLIRPQAHLCSCGADKRFDPTAFIRKHVRSGKRARHFEK